MVVVPIGGVATSYMCGCGQVALSVKRESVWRFNDNWTVWVWSNVTSDEGNCKGEMNNF